MVKLGKLVNRVYLFSLRTRNAKPRKREMFFLSFSPDQIPRAKVNIIIHWEGPQLFHLRAWKKSTFGPQFLQATLNPARFVFQLQFNEKQKYALFSDD